MQNACKCYEVFLQQEGWSIYWVSQMQFPIHPNTSNGSNQLNQRSKWEDNHTFLPLFNYPILMFQCKNRGKEHAKIWKMFCNFLAATLQLIGKPEKEGKNFRTQPKPRQIIYHYPWQKVEHANKLRKTSFMGCYGTRENSKTRELNAAFFHFLRFNTSMQVPLH